MGRIWILIMVLSGLVAACSGPRRPPEQLVSRFDTRILDNGSKQFEYSLMPERGPDERRAAGRGAEPALAQGTAPSGGQRGAPPAAGRGDGRAVGPGGGRQPLLDEGELEARVAAELQANQFCRDGYLELQRDDSQWPLRLRGECLDGATTADRQRFANTLEWR